MNVPRAIAVMLTATAAPAAWSPVPVTPETNGPVYAVSTSQGGNVAAGGAFTTIAGVPANHVALWNGAAWLPLGAGTNSFVNAVTNLPNGDLVAGGQFTIAGGVQAPYVARWNGGTWSALGSGLAGGYVDALVTLPTGELVAGGQFIIAGGARSPACCALGRRSVVPAGQGDDRL